MQIATFLWYMQIKVLPEDHNCPTTKLVGGKMATQSWVADMLADWVKKNPHKVKKGILLYICAQSTPFQTSPIEIHTHVLGYEG